jgi:DNA-binding response OmpR family regulator
MAILQKNTKRTLLVVDDDEVMQLMLQKYLSSQFFSTKNLYEGRELPTLLKKNRIDLIVLDVMLPDKSGLYWLKWLRMYYAHIPVIMASAKTDQDDRLLGLESGARDYLVKPFQYKELLIRIENILGSSPPADDVKLITIGDMKLDTVMLTLAKKGSEIKLTELETDILKLMHINSGAVISRDDIMMQVRGTQHNPLDRSIDIHINNLRKKIEDCPAEPTYIRTVRGKGYRLHIPDQY